MEQTTEQLREKMAALGRVMTEKKRAALRENPKGERSPESRANMKAAQQARRTKEIAEGKREPPKPKRPRGRPKKRKEGKEENATL